MYTLPILSSVRNCKLNRYTTGCKNTGTIAGKDFCVTSLELSIILFNQSHNDTSLLRRLPAHPSQWMFNYKQNPPFFFSNITVTFEPIQRCNFDWFKWSDGLWSRIVSWILNVSALYFTAENFSLEIIFFLNIYFESIVVKPYGDKTQRKGGIYHKVIMLLPSLRLHQESGYNYLRLAAKVKCGSFTLL